jgi:hypothetical protein
MATAATSTAAAAAELQQRALRGPALPGGMILEEPEQVVQHQLAIYTTWDQHSTAQHSTAQASVKARQPRGHPATAGSSSPSTTRNRHPTPPPG